MSSLYARLTMHTLDVYERSSIQSVTIHVYDIFINTNTFKTGILYLSSSHLTWWHNPTKQENLKMIIIIKIKIKLTSELCRSLF